MSIRTGLRTRYNERPNFRKWLRAASPSVALLIPLLYQINIPSDPDYQLLIYLFGVLLVGTLGLLDFDLGKRFIDEILKERDAAQREAEKLKSGLENQARIMSYISHIVGTKSARFVRIYKEYENEGVRRQVPAAEIFDKITQPEIQIEYILENIVRFFETNREQHHATAILFQADLENSYFRYPWVYPPDKRPSVPEGEWPIHAGVPGAALRWNDVVVIPSIAAERKADSPTYFFHHKSSGSKAGSVVCKPLMDLDRGGPPYVLSVYIDKEGLFQDKDYLRSILEPFEQRIILEDRLRHLKNRTRPLETP